MSRPARDAIPIRSDGPRDKPGTGIVAKGADFAETTKFDSGKPHIFLHFYKVRTNRNTT
jgi:hypothetical protein